jgi:hypothetical protein
MNEIRNATTYLLTYWLTNWQLCEIAELLIFREVLTTLDISRKKQNCSNHQLEVVLFPPEMCAFFLSFSWITSHTPRLQITWVLWHHKTQPEGNIKKLQCQRLTTSAGGGIVGSSLASCACINPTYLPL